MCIPLGLRALPRTEPQHTRSLDLPGQVLAVIALGSLTFALIQGGGGWTRAQVLGAGTAALLAGAAFIVVEQRSASPMVPLQLFSRPSFTVGAIAGASVHFGVWATVFILSLLFQEIRHYSAFATGLALVPMGLVGAPIAFLSGRLTARVGPRLPMTFGLFTAGAGGAVLAFSHASSPYAVLGIGIATLSLGISLALPATVALVTTVVPLEETGVASGVINASRQTGGVIGVAVVGGIVSTRGYTSGAHVAFLVIAAAYAFAALLAAIWVRALPSSAVERATTMAEEIATV